MTEGKRKRGRPKGSGKKKVEANDPIAIPYKRSTSEDPKEQSMIDLMETGRSVMHFSTDGIRRIDPLSDEAAAALYNAEHTNQFTMVKTMTLAEAKKKFGEAAIPKPERPYPSNWNELGKVAKLQWLTEHRK